MASLERHYISTGHLPAPEMVQSLVQDTLRRSKSNSDGKNSQAYPALARVPSELFGVCVVGTSGRIYGAGDVDYEFSIMGVSKPFLFALICETIGPEEARAKLGANATGLPFRTTLRGAIPSDDQGQRPEIDPISLARHVPLHGSRRRR
jgi:glutaminase